MRNILIICISVVYLSFIFSFSYRVTGAFFTANASSTGNTFSAANTFPNLHVVISEVQTATPSATTSDFIELYNPTSSSVNLNNFRLVKRTSSGTTDTTIKSFGSSDVIQAHGYYLWSSTDGGYNAIIHADAATGVNIADNNSIALRNGAADTGTIIDAIGWGTLTGTPLIEGIVFPTNPSAGQSLERKANASSTATSMTTGVDISAGNGFDDDNNANDFVLRPASLPQNSTSPTEP